MRGQLVVPAFAMSASRCCGAAAAVRTGYSAKTADRQTYALLRNPEISKIVAATEALRLEENSISATRVLEETRRIALNDPRRFLTADGSVQPITLWTGEMAAAVASIEVVKKQAAAGDRHTATVVKLKFLNKNQAIELLAQHLQLLDPEAVPAAAVPCFVMPPRDARRHRMTNCLCGIGRPLRAAAAAANQMRQDRVNVAQHSERPVSLESESRDL